MGIIFEKLIEIQCLIFLKFIHLHLLLFEVTLNVVVWQHMLELPSSLESSGPPALDSRWCHPKWRPFSFGFSAAQENTWVNAELQVVMGPGHKFWPGSGQIFGARVESGQPSLIWVWVWKISPTNGKLSNFLPFRSKSTRVKAESASYLLRIKSYNVVLAHILSCF